MQISPDATGFTGPIGGPPLDPVDNVAVAHLLTLAGSTLIGCAVFDRTVASQAPTTFGRATDNWHWTTAGSEWPSVGFKLRIRKTPPFKPHVGGYATWPDQPMVTTPTPPPATPRYQVLCDDGATRTLMGELLVEKTGHQWRTTWWTDAAHLVDDRLRFDANVDYRFEPVTAGTRLDTTRLWSRAHGLTGLKAVTPG